MSEDSTPVQPDTFTSPLRTIMLEMHEVYEELLGVGFTERASTSILAHMMLDIMLYRGDSVEDEDDEETESDDEYDDRGPDSGTE